MCYQFLTFCICESQQIQIIFTLWNTLLRIKQRSLSRKKVENSRDIRQETEEKCKEALKEVSYKQTVTIKSLYTHKTKTKYKKSCRETGTIYNSDMY